MASFDINTFKAALGQTGARPSYYRVAFQGIPSIEGTADLQDSNLRLLVKTTSLPGVAIAEFDVVYMGRIVKYPGEKTFESPWTVTFMNDENFKIRDAFLAWMDGIALSDRNSGSVRGRGTTSDPASYQAIAKVSQLSKSGETLKTIELINVWPSEVAAIELSYESPDEIEEFEVSLQYDYWIDKGTESI